MHKTHVDRQVIAVTVGSVFAVSLAIAVVLGYAVWSSSHSYEPSAIDKQVQHALAEHAATEPTP